MNRESKKTRAGNDMGDQSNCTLLIAHVWPLKTRSGRQDCFGCYCFFDSGSENAM
jgi:hypothetical protein